MCAIVRENRSAELQLFNTLLDAITENRQFERQIRSEECGRCTTDLADSVVTALLLSSNQDRTRKTVEIIERLTAFTTMPRYLNRVLLHLVRTCRKDYRDLGAYASPHPITVKRLAAELTGLAGQALEHYCKGRYVVFCRIAFPMQHVFEEYKALVRDFGVPADWDATPALQQVKDKVDALERTAGTDVDKWVRAQWGGEGRNRRFYDEDKTMADRKEKRVWSGGQGETQGGVQMSIINYSPTHMLVLTREPLVVGTDHSANCHFSCVDPKFEVRFNVKEDLSTKYRGQNPRPHDRLLTAAETTWNHQVYLCRFTPPSENKEPFPYPVLATFSLCADVSCLNISVGIRATLRRCSWVAFLIRR